jgi:hypothetical protein
MVVCIKNTACTFCQKFLARLFLLVFKTACFVVIICVLSNYIWFTLFSGCFVDTVILINAVFQRFDMVVCITNTACTFCQ